MKSGKIVSFSAILIDMLYWGGCFLLFYSLPDSFWIKYPLWGLFLGNIAIFIFRECLHSFLCLFSSEKDISFKLFCIRVCYAVGIVHFFLLSVRYIGVVNLLLAVPLLELLALFYIFRPVSCGKDSSTLPSEVREYALKLEQYWELKHITFEILDSSVNRIYSQFRPYPKILLSTTFNSLMPDEKKFLLAHEMSHFHHHHFQKKNLFEFSIVIFQSIIPFIVLCLFCGDYWHAGTWVSPIYYPIPLLAMTFVNIPFLYLTHYFYFRLECQADLDAAILTQQPDNAKKMMLWSANYPEKISPEINQRAETLASKHRALLMGELETFCSYLCLTYRCNSRCKFCASDLTGSRNDISLQNIQKYLQRDLGPHEGLILSGGEPLLHPDFQKITEMIRGKYKKISLMTNGVCIPTMPSVVSAIKEKVFTNIAIPLYGASAEIHDDLTGIRGNWAKANQTLEIISELPIRLELKMLWSPFTMYENLKILDMLEKNKLPKPTSLSLTHIIWGEKADRVFDLGKMDFTNNLSVLNETVERMLNYDFTLQNIPLCWLTHKNLLDVLEKETRPPVVVRIFYQAPQQSPYFISHVPEEKPECQYCFLRARCSRFYPDQESGIMSYLPVSPVDQHLQPLFENRIKFQ